MPLGQQRRELAPHIGRDVFTARNCQNSARRIPAACYTCIRSFDGVTPRALLLARLEPAGLVILSRVAFELAGIGR